MSIKLSLCLFFTLIFSLPQTGLALDSVDIEVTGVSTGLQNPDGSPLTLEEGEDISGTWGMVQFFGFAPQATTLLGELDFQVHLSVCLGHPLHGKADFILEVPPFDLNSDCTEEGAQLFPATWRCSSNRAVSQGLLPNDTQASATGNADGSVDATVSFDLTKKEMESMFCMCELIKAEGVAPLALSTCSQPSVL